MKKHKVIIYCLFMVCLFLTACIISRPQPQDCEVVNTTIVKITEGPTFDIVFHNVKGDYYYINRGLEQGLNLDELNSSVLNKNVTLHLAKIWGGSVVSEHIAQLAIDEKIIYTEFK
ncbi:MAG: hypothetical protein HKN00_02255 [Flavobacteriaceae bacterium]|nr:hypothetical protein [Bacteroidia bacterium]MBT8287665.1 hypothetical protein [Bacteroidia bacterium]NNF73978.1 hypothetical protein [Flavobacteriaceae bacterium]NNK72072.1 hypothetical protein [Flavobacteriaceae bacterium]